MDETKLVIKSKILKKCMDKTISNIEIPDSVTSIGNNAFSSCTSPEFLGTRWKTEFATVLSYLINEE